MIAAIAHSIISSVGYFVVIFWSQTPGAEIILVNRLSYFPAIFIISYPMPTTTGRRRILMSVLTKVEGTLPQIVRQRGSIKNEIKIPIRSIKIRKLVPHLG